MESDFGGLDTDLSPMSKPIDRAMGVARHSVVRRPMVDAVGPPRLIVSHGCQKGGSVLPMLVVLGPGWQATCEQKATCPWLGLLGTNTTSRGGAVGLPQHPPRTAS